MEADTYNGEPFPVGEKEIIVLPCNGEETGDMGDLVEEGVHC